MGEDAKQVEQIDSDINLINLGIMIFTLGVGMELTLTAAQGVNDPSALPLYSNPQFLLGVSLLTGSTIYVISKNYLGLKKADQDLLYFAISSFQKSKKHVLDLNTQWDTSKKLSYIRTAIGLLKPLLEKIMSNIEYYERLIEKQPTETDKIYWLVMQIDYDIQKLSGFLLCLRQRREERLNLEHELDRIEGEIRRWLDGITVKSLGDTGGLNRENLLSESAAHLKTLEEYERRYNHWFHSNSGLSPLKKLDDSGKTSINLKNLIRQIGETKKRIEAQLRRIPDEKFKAKTEKTEKEVVELRQTAKVLLETIGYKLPQSSDTVYGRLFVLINSHNTLKDDLSQADKLFWALSRSCGLLLESLSTLDVENYAIQSAIVIANQKEVHEKISDAETFLYNLTHTKTDPYEKSTKEAKKIPSHLRRKSSIGTHLVSSISSQADEVYLSGNEISSISSSSSSTHSFGHSRVETTRSLKETKEVPRDRVDASLNLGSSALFFGYKKKAYSYTDVAYVARWLESLLTDHEVNLYPIHHSYACIAATFYLAEATQRFFRSPLVRRLRNNLAGNIGLLKDVTRLDILEIVKEFINMIKRAEDYRTGELAFQAPKNTWLIRLMVYELPRGSQPLPGFPLEKQLGSLNEEIVNPSLDTRALWELVNCFRMSQKQLLRLIELPLLYQRMAIELRHDKALECLMELEDMWMKGIFHDTASSASHAVHTA